MTGGPITWGAYLRLIAKAGVELGTCEEAALSESGERITTRMLTRVVDGVLLGTEAAFEDETDPIPYYRRRQIANELKLPVERFVFDDHP